MSSSFSSFFYGGSFTGSSVISNTFTFGSVLKFFITSNYSVYLAKISLSSYSSSSSSISDSVSSSSPS